MIAINKKGQISIFIIIGAIIILVLLLFLSSQFVGKAITSPSELGEGEIGLSIC